MPDKKGRFSGKEKAFVKAMARYNDTEVAATKAGYSSPRAAGWRLSKNPLIAEATREEARKFLLEKGGAIGVYTLAMLATDEKQPAGARVTAATNLAKLSGIGVDDAAGDKDPHEMTSNELHSTLGKLERQREALERALADQARPVIEQEDNPKSGAFS